MSDDMHDEDVSCGEGDEDGQDQDDEQDQEELHEEAGGSMEIEISTGGDDTHSELQNDFNSTSETPNFSHALS